jgi:CBS domain-containing protein
MVTPVVTVTPRTTYEDAAFLLHKHHVSGMPVVGSDNVLVGIISEKDLFQALYPLYAEYISTPEAYADQEKQEDEIENVRKQPVEKYMKRNVITVDANACILNAGGLMLAHGIHRLPVVLDGKLVGIVTRENIYGTILKKHLGKDAKNGE